MLVRYESQALSQPWFQARVCKRWPMSTSSETDNFKSSCIEAEKTKAVQTVESSTGKDAVAKNALGVVHKVRHAIFLLILIPSLCHT